MPKVRRSKKPPPDGWELIEPTLEELEQKMREGEFAFGEVNRFVILYGLYWIVRRTLVRDSDLMSFVSLQPRQNLTRAKGSRNLCGRYSRSIIKSHVTYTTCFIGGKRSVAVSRDAIVDVIRLCSPTFLCTFIFQSCTIIV